MLRRNRKRSSAVVVKKTFSRLSRSLDDAARTARKAGARVRGRLHDMGSRPKTLLRTAGAVAGGVVTVALLRRVPSNGR